MSAFILKNAMIYDYKKKSLAKKDIQVENGIIITIESEIKDNADLKVIDAKNQILLPGMIDIHNDEIENAISPKRNCFFCEEDVFHHLMLGFYSSGITTVYHALAYSIEPGIRNYSTAHEILKQLERFKTHFVFPNSLKINLRVEITSDWTSLVSFIDEFRNLIGIITLCDHSPNNKQEWSIQKYKRYLSSRALIDEHSYKELLKKMVLNKQRNLKLQEGLVNLLKEKKYIVGIHDLVGSDEYIVNIDFAEFPTNLNVIDFLKNKKKCIAMGAPNLRQGKSINNNISAGSVCKNEKCDILCSDYNRISMLKSVYTFSQFQKRDFFEDYKMVSFNPSKLLNVKKGQIRKGYEADFILVTFENENIKVHKTFIGGKMAYESCF